jgi:hypothetical protein
VSTDPDELTIQVKLDIDETVSFLKKLIKNEYSPRFDGIGAYDLVLWKCSIPIDDNLKKNLDKIRFDGTDPSVQRIRPAASEISEHFPTILPYKTIQILVRWPLVSMASVSPFQQLKRECCRRIRARPPCCSAGGNVTQSDRNSVYWIMSTLDGYRGWN